MGDSINLAVPNSKTRRGRVGKGIAQTLDTGMQQYTIANTIDANYAKGWSPNGQQNQQRVYPIDGVIRRLTPIECERLQGFPDNWTKTGTTCTAESKETRAVCSNHNVEISDTQRYKCCGNAVTVNVIRDVMERVLNG